MTWRASDDPPSPLGNLSVVRYQRDAIPSDTAVLMASIAVPYTDQYYCPLWRPVHISVSAKSEPRFTHGVTHGVEQCAFLSS